MNTKTQTSGQTHSAPIAVIGGGVMGALTALTASHQGIEVLWFAPPETGRSDGADVRNYALSPVTVDLLKRLGVWPSLEQSSCLVTRMEVYSGAARIDLSASDAGTEFLSVMLLHRDLLSGCEQAVKFRPQIQRISHRPDQLTITAEGVTLTAEQRSYSAQLVVGADGARSWVRSQAGILWGQRDYGQQGVVAIFRTEYPHGGVAVQWFDEGDVLALLPLADPNLMSMVWSTSRTEPTSEIAINEFAARVADRTAGRFGALTLEGEASSAPLRMMLTDRQSSLRTALVGDAAHTVHPLAGYGLNLGVQDLLSLEDIWKSHRMDPGAAAALTVYEKARHRRVRRVQWSLDVLQRLVSQTHPTFLKIREFGMRVVANTGPLRQFLIKQAISPQ